MQTSVMYDKKITPQQHQASIDLLNPAYQHITPMVRSAAARNRTRRAEGTREGCKGLYEIEEHATKGKTKNMQRNDLMILDMERTCSTRNKTAAYKAGQRKITNYADSKKRQGAYGRAKLSSRKGRRRMRTLPTLTQKPFHLQ